MNKKGIELAASLIVVLIVSIIILGLAGGLTYKIICASSAKVSELDAQTEKLLEQKLDSGARVQVADSVKTAKSRASFCTNEAPGAAYALGVRNDGTDARGASYTIECEYKGIDNDGKYSPPGSSSCAGLVSFTSDTGTIPPKAKVTKLLLVTGPNEPGKHDFTVYVCDDAGALNGAGLCRADAPSFYGAATISYIVQ